MDKTILEAMERQYNSNLLRQTEDETFALINLFKKFDVKETIERRNEIIQLINFWRD